MMLKQIAQLRSGTAAGAHALALAQKRRATWRRIGATRRGTGERWAARRFNDAISKRLGRSGGHSMPAGRTFRASVGSLSGLRSAHIAASPSSGLLML